MYRPYQCTNRYTCTLGTRIFGPYSFLISNSHGAALFLRGEKKGSKIRENLSDSVFNIHGIEMVGTVNQVFGFMGYFTIFTQIPRDRENGRCHSWTGHHGRKMERISQKKVFHETGKRLLRLVSLLSGTNNSKIGGTTNNECKK